jgi:hypothetical protein
MQFQVTQIEFDFTDDYDELDVLDVISQDEIVDKTLQTIWNVDEESSLADVISDTTGWCVNSIQYQEIK